MTRWSATDATTGRVLYEGASEAKARRTFAAAKATARTFLRCDGQPVAVALDPPPIKSEDHQRARGMYH